MEKNREHARAVFDWVAEKRLTPHLDARVPFTDAAEALERLRRREVKGKLVLVP